jgi:hypothetical protein
MHPELGRLDSDPHSALSGRFGHVLKSQSVPALVGLSLTRCPPLSRVAAWPPSHDLEDPWHASARPNLGFEHCCRASPFGVWSFTARDVRFVIRLKDAVPYEVVDPAASEGMTLDLEPLPVPEPGALPGNCVILGHHAVHDDRVSSGMLHGIPDYLPGVRRRSDKMLDQYQP